MISETRNLIQCQPEVLYFQDVKNSKEILQRAMKGDLPCAFLNPQLILHSFQIFVAAQFAADAYLNKQIKTKNVFVEILYNISPSKKITEALKQFGINDQLTELLCVTLSSDASKIVAELVEGELVELERLPNDPPKISKIKAMYNITDEEVQTTDLLDILVNRISAKTVSKI